MSTPFYPNLLFSAKKNEMLLLMKAKTRETRINVRTTEEIKRDLEVAAELRGITVSSLINQLARMVIREEKDREPDAFIVAEVKDFGRGSDEKETQ